MTALTPAATGEKKKKEKKFRFTNAQAWRGCWPFFYGAFYGLRPRWGEEKGEGQVPVLAPVLGRGYTPCGPLRSEKGKRAAPACCRGRETRLFGAGRKGGREKRPTRQLWGLALNWQEGPIALPARRKKGKKKKSGQSQVPAPRSSQPAPKFPRPRKEKRKREKLRRTQVFFT